ncbi:MAG: YihA family ribosome biogenesis GTP-binding protein [Myxococcales bacterium]|nr:YihA family ribosome biogenesis GTP-binding protein [Myxococcales bacterium]MCB9752824.1 YihA family ribosome biogenesis GTP-binding protein [Myxococcales bacterium]
MSGRPGKQPRSRDGARGSQGSKAAPARQPKARARPGWRVVSAEFELSAPELRACPAGDRPEIAVAGRSNVGKSSLLNAFASRRGLARVSRTPGRTRLLNFFTITLRHPKRGDRSFRWVDLPGYGYAAAARSVRQQFGPMIEGYLAGRDVLRGLVLLIDSRRGVREEDVELVHFMGAHGVPTLVVATKADKLSKGERGLVPRTIAEQLGCHSGDIVLTSALAGDGLGDDGRRGGLAAELAALVAPREPARDEEESPREPARDDNETALAAEPPEAERRAGG